MYYISQITANDMRAQKTRTTFVNNLFKIIFKEKTQGFHGTNYVMLNIFLKTQTKFIN